MSKVAGVVSNFKGCPSGVKDPEMEFVTHVTHGGSVKFLPAV